MTEPDDELSMTLEDAYLLGDADTRQEIEDLLARHTALMDSIDQETLRLVRTGGHVVRVFNTGGRPEVQIDIYRTGPAYGAWTLRCSVEGHQVYIEHLLPEEYNHDGSWMCSRPHKSWTCPANAWRSDPVAMISDLVGKKVATEAAPLLALPDNIAPDAR